MSQVLNTHFCSHGLTLEGESFYSMDKSMMSYGSIRARSAGQDNRDVGETEMCAQVQRRPWSRQEART